MPQNYITVIFAELKPLLRELENTLKSDLRAELGRISIRETEGYFDEDDKKGRFLHVALTRGWFFRAKQVASVSLKVYGNPTNPDRYEGGSILVFSSHVPESARLKIKQAIEDFNTETHLSLQIHYS